jgi:O-methyltransferase
MDDSCRRKLDRKCDSLPGIVMQPTEEPLRSIFTRLQSRGYRALWYLWSRRGVDRIGTAVIDRLPARTRRWVEMRKRDVRRSPSFQPILAERLLDGREAPLVPKEKLEEAYREALNHLASAPGSNDVGDYLEFGVYVGTSLLCMNRASRAVGLESLRMYGFDSFQGLPEVAGAESGGLWQPGWLRAEYGLVREHLTRNGIDWGRTTLVPGWFEETLGPGLAHELGIKKAGIIMIDCEIYSAALTAVTFCAPLIRDRAWVFLDGWNRKGAVAKASTYSGVLGERRALAEVLAANPDLQVEEELSPYKRASKVLLVTRRRAVTTDDGTPRAA